MNYQSSRFGHIVQINRNLLFSTGFAFTAWLSWPNSPKWWGLGVMSVFCTLVALALLFQAVRLMYRIYKREQAIAAFIAQGNQPKTSVLVSNRGLQDAGMRDE